MKSLRNINKTNVLITGSEGLVGKSLINFFKEKKLKIFSTNKKQLNLENYNKLFFFLKKNKIHVVINAAAMTGGILRNQNNLITMLEKNIFININIIKACHQARVKQLIYLGSSCIYPKKSKIPIKEESILGSYLEPTNEGYALSKIIGAKLCGYYNDKYKSDFRCLMPCNLVGPGDKYDIHLGHVVPSLVKKFCDAVKYRKKKVFVWGTGEIYREFLDVRDLANTIYLIMNKSRRNYEKITKDFLINIGANKQYKIKTIVNLIKNLTNYKGKIIYNRKYPDGVWSKKVSTIRLRKLIKGWKTNFNIKQSLQDCISDYKKNYDNKNSSI